MSKQIWHRCVKKRFSPSSNSKIIDTSLYFLLSLNNSCHHRLMQNQWAIVIPTSKGRGSSLVLGNPSRDGYQDNHGCQGILLGGFCLHQFYLLFSSEHWVICSGLPWPSPGWCGWLGLSLSWGLHCPFWWPGPSACASPPAASSSPAAAAPSSVSWLPEREGWKHKVQTTCALLSWGRVIKETSRYQGSCQRTFLTIYQDLIPSCFGKCRMSPGNVCGRAVTAVTKCSEQKLFSTERRRELLSKQC